MITDHVRKNRLIMRSRQPESEASIFRNAAEAQKLSHATWHSVSSASCGVLNFDPVRWNLEQTLQLVRGFCLPLASNCSNTKVEVCRSP